MSTVTILCMRIGVIRSTIVFDIRDQSATCAVAVLARLTAGPCPIRPKFQTGRMLFVRMARKTALFHSKRE
jgi:hypothetical protein